jgi:hypothetical protein
LWRGNKNKGKRVTINEEFAGLDFNSIRLEKGFIRAIETLAKQPGKFIRAASSNKAEAKAI